MGVKKCVNQQKNLSLCQNKRAQKMNQKLKGIVPEECVMA
jgi:hypothetical protein